MEEKRTKNEICWNIWKIDVRAETLLLIVSFGNNRSRLNTRYVGTSVSVAIVIERHS